MWEGKGVGGFRCSGDPCSRNPGILPSQNHLIVVQSQQPPQHSTYDHSVGCRHLWSRNPRHPRGTESGGGASDEELDAGGGEDEDETDARRGVRDCWIYGASSSPFDYAEPLTPSRLLFKVGTPPGS